MSVNGLSEPESSQHSATASKKNKKLEIITCDNIQAIEVGLDDDELGDDPLASKSFELAEPSTSEAPPPIRLVMKLPKTATTTAPPVMSNDNQPTTVSSQEPALVKPLKLKLKLPPNPETGSTEAQIIQVEKSSLTTKSKGAKSHKMPSKNNEDDELINDLKNAYVDGDFGKSRSTDTVN